MTPLNSHLSSLGLQPILHRWLPTNSSTCETKASLSAYLLPSCHLFSPPFHILHSLFFFASHPFLLFFRLCFSLPSHPPSRPCQPSFSCRFRCLTVLLVRPSLRSSLPSRSPPLFILGSPTVVMRCFIICISQLLIEREFRLSPGSSVRELPWETSQA